ncbi:MAG: IS4 family transposase [Candidatus Poribacteria bacterium]|nr:IS4 family transposase [Candidatus Poribacteria bacterium]
MATSRKKVRSKCRPRVATNPGLRRRTQVPAPSCEAIEQELRSLLVPNTLVPRKDPSRKGLFRERILTLPTMVALVVSLVWRGFASLSDLLRLLETEDLLWVKAVKVSKQALSKRLARLPASLFFRVLEEVLKTIRAKQETPAPPRPFSAVWMADGSTLEALKKRLKDTLEETPVLGGKALMVVEADTHTPVTVFYTPEAQANDKTFTDPLLAQLPKEGLLIFDMGFFSFPFFDGFTDEEKFFATRMREKTAYEVLRVFQATPYVTDAWIRMGLYRSNPCRHPVRLVEVRWNGTTFRYLTNVLDPERLSAQEVCELYRRRWRIEDAFLLTKRLLGLAYLWVGNSNGIQVQLVATLIFYAVLNHLTQQVAVALSLPLERISVEMGFRGLYFYHRAEQRKQATEVVTYMAENARMLGVVKAIRKRHREKNEQQQLIWGLS